MDCRQIAVDEEMQFIENIIKSLAGGLNAHQGY